MTANKYGRRLGNVHRRLGNVFEVTGAQHAAIEQGTRRETQLSRAARHGRVWLSGASSSLLAMVVRVGAIVSGVHELAPVSNGNINDIRMGCAAGWVVSNPKQHASGVENRTTTNSDQWESNLPS
ncbi:hypothetical protein AAHA92_16883 [Salvia divinorum]|uniref:Uncharacterized protein n=1 Tax=Salvia divinorum TaxID=28513 RepID=A0ABD1H0F9_SALDI